jgi:hypothetical protein
LTQSADTIRRGTDAFNAFMRRELSTEAYAERFDPCTGATNVRRRILAKAVGYANSKLVECRQEQLPKGLAPQSLRRTFASILFAVGESPPYVMSQMGHTTPNLTLSV